MSYRIFMTINRGMTDKTAVCVFPWEKPLLEEVHGSGAEEVSIEEMVDIKKGVAKVKPIKIKADRVGVSEAPPLLKDQLQKMTVVDNEDDPKYDLDTEYGRLAEKYGMHPDVALPVVEKVYGSPTLFKQAVRPFLGTTPPPDEIDPTEARGARPRQEAGSEAPEKPIAEMGRNELKAFLHKHKIEFSAKASIDDLRDLAETALA